MQSIQNLRDKLEGLSPEEASVAYIAFLEETDDRDPSEIIEVCQEILRLQSSSHDSKNEEKALSYLAKAYSTLGNYQQSVQYLQQILQTWDKSMGERIKADYMSRLGVACWHLGDYEKALQNLIDALSFFESIDDKTRIADLQCNVSIIFAEIEENEKSEEYIRKALDTAERNGDEDQQAAFLNNLGILLFRKSMKQEGLECFLRSAEIKERLGQSRKLTTTYVNIAESYEDLGEREKIVPFLEKAIDLAERHHDAECLIKCMRHLGVYYMDESDFDKAAEHLNEAMKLLEGSTLLKERSRTLEALSTLHERNGDFAGALKCQKEQATVDKKFFSEETAKRIAEIHALYETKKKIAEAELLKEKTKELSRLNLKISEQYESLKSAEGALKEVNKELREQMEIDSLTTLLNNQRLYEKLQDKIERSRNREQALSVIMLDLDHFKDINDHYGHPVGNKALRALGATIKESIRRGDIAFRFGGEEFLVVLPDTTRAVAVRIAERIRRAVEIMGFHNDLKMTISAGVKEFSDHDAHALIVEADKFLYEAKKRGRNMVIG